MLIFISYSSKNRSLIQSLADDLDEPNIDVWFDQKLTGGREWWSDILEHIRQCDLFLSALTPESLESRPCQLEYTYAFNLKKRILPIVLRDVKLTTLPPILQILQAVDYRLQSKEQLKILRRALYNLPQPVALPDPLPEAPSPPISPISAVLERINAPSLTTDEQRLLVFDLEELMADPEYSADAQAGLMRLLKRDDLLVKTAARIRKTLGGDSQEGRISETSELLTTDVETTALTSGNYDKPHWLNHNGAVISVACSPGGMNFITGSTDRIVRLWKLPLKSESVQLLGHLNRVTSAAFSPDGRFALTGSDDKTAIVWDIEAKRSMAVLRGHTSSVECVAYLPDGRTALTGSSDGTIRLWDTKTYDEIRQLNDAMIPISCMALSPDGAVLITDGFARHAIMWEVTTGTKVHELIGHKGKITSIAISTDGKYVVTGSTDETARLWDSTSGVELQRLIGHTNDINAVAFSSDGEHVATGGSDGTARLWEITTGKEVRQFIGHSHKVLSVAFVPKQNLLITGSADNTAGIWQI